MITDKVQDAFKHLEKGHFKKFTDILVNTADRSIRSETHRSILDREVEKQLKYIACKKEGDKIICKFKGVKK